MVDLKGKASADENPVEWRGRKFWPTWELARLHKTFENGVWVLRWQKNNATYKTLYC